MMDIFDVKRQFYDDFSAADFFTAAEAAIEPAQTIIKNIWYIHGNRRAKNKKLILGHAPESEFERKYRPFSFTGGLSLL